MTNGGASHVAALPDDRVGDVAIAGHVPYGPRRAWLFVQDHMRGGGVRQESLARNTGLALQQ